MNQIIIIGIAVSVLFIIIKFIEMRVMGERLPLKTVVKDAFVAMTSSITIAYAMSKFNFFNSNTFIEQKVFTDSPNF